MQLNIKKIDERLQKLQEIKRIASDPELVSMIVEFISQEDERTESVQPNKPQPAVTSQLSDIDLVNQVVKGTDAQGNGFWAPRKP
jgi:hypothetical protein